MAMFKNKRIRRLENEVNAGSMADIAFLLLIFFLVTTTILNDQGIQVRLPPWDDSPPQKLSENNVLSIKVNGQNQLMVEGEEFPVAALKERVKTFITNPTRDSKLPTTPKNAILSLQNDRNTAYKTYLEIYNELKAAYNELWDQAARRRFQSDYLLLSKQQQDQIRKDIPLVISEAEPTDLFPSN